MIASALSALHKGIFRVFLVTLSIIALAGTSWAAAIKPVPGIYKQPATTTSPSIIQNRTGTTLQRMPGNAVITVRDATGAPVGAATVNTTVNGQPLSQQTNALGQVALPNLPAGQYIVTAAKRGYYPQAPNSTVTINPGVTTTSEFVLLKYGAIKVTVTDGRSALSGVVVRIPSSTPPVSLLTDAGGVAAIGNLAAGRYTVSVAKAGTAGIQVAATVTSGQETALPVTLTPQATTGSLAVTVRDGAAPLEGATVTAYSYVDTKTLTATTNQQGVATFASLPVGSCSIHAKKSGYTIVTTAAVENQKVEIAPGQTTQASILMNKQTASIDVYAYKAPIKSRLDGATVILSGPGIQKTQITDSQGNTRFTGLPNGNYQVIVKKDTFKDSAPYQLKIDAPITMTVNVTMYLTPKTTYQVTDNGAPVSGAAVSLATALAGAGQPVNAVTDGQGIAVFNNLDLLVYNVTVSKSGYATHKSQLTNMTADNPVVTTNVALVKYAAMEVTVTDGVNPLAGATVDTQIYAVPQTRTTDAQGKAVFSDLQPGRYTFTARKQGYPTDSRLIDLAAGDAKSLALSLPVYRVVSVNATPAALRVGQRNNTLSVTLDRPAPNGARVWLSSSEPALVALPESVWVPNGTASVSTTFSTGVPPESSVMTAPRSVTLTAASGADRTTTTSPATTTVTLSPIMLKTFGMLVQPPQPVYAGNTIGLDSGIGGLAIDFSTALLPIQVRLSSAEPDILNFTGTWESSPTPYICTIPANMTATNFKVNAISHFVRKTYIGEDRTVTIYADYLGQRLTATVPVLWPRAIASLVITPPNQYGTNTATITLDRPAPANGLQVQISSSNRAAFLNLPYAVNFGGGQTSATFALAIRGGTTGASVTVTTAPYWNSSASATVPLK